MVKAKDSIDSKITTRRNRWRGIFADFPSNLADALKQNTTVLAVGVSKKVHIPCNRLLKCNRASTVS